MRATISLATFFVGFASAIEVYLNPPLSSTTVLSTIPNFSPSEARVVLAHHLGLAAHESATDSELEFLEETIGTFDNEIGSGVSNALLVSLDETIAKHVIPRELHSIFRMLNPPNVENQVSWVISAFLHRAKSTYASYITPSASSSTPSVPRLLDIFTLKPSSQSTEKFISETAALVQFIEEGGQDIFGAFELKGLAEMAAQYGLQSEEFSVAAETLKALFSSAISDPKVALAVITYPGSSHQHSQRQQPPSQSPLPLPTLAPQMPIGSISTCHQSQAACINATDSCSGRGTCSQATKAGRSCFVCACNVTQDERGGKEWWVGDACERKDISGPFVLITGTVVAIVLTIIGSISLLLSVGGQQLPPTLTGGSAPGHLKRD